MKCIEEDLHKNVLKMDKKTQQINTLTAVSHYSYLKEKTSQHSLLKEKELHLETLRRQLNESRDELALKDSELQDCVRRISDEEKEKQLRDRQDKTRLQQELEMIQANYKSLEQ